MSSTTRASGGRSRRVSAGPRGSGGQSCVRACAAARPRSPSVPQRALRARDLRVGWTCVCGRLAPACVSGAAYVSGAACVTRLCAARQSAACITSPEEMANHQTRTLARAAAMVPGGRGIVGTRTAAAAGAAAVAAVAAACPPPLRVHRGVRRSPHSRCARLFNAPAGSLCAAPYWCKYHRECSGRVCVYVCILVYVCMCVCVIMCV